MHPRCSLRCYSYRWRRRATSAYPRDSVAVCEVVVQHVWCTRAAAAHKRPCALIFPYLVKAFDRVLRAVVMGDSSISSDPASGDQVRERWRESGVPYTVVNDAITYVRKTGGVLGEAALHPGLLHLLRDLHDRTWFQLDAGYVIETSLGS